MNDQAADEQSAPSQSEGFQNQSVSIRLEECLILDKHRVDQRGHPICTDYQRVGYGLHGPAYDKNKVYEKGERAVKDGKTYEMIANVKAAGLPPLGNALQGHENSYWKEIEEDNPWFALHVHRRQVCP